MQRDTRPRTRRGIKKGKEATKITTVCTELHA